MKLKLNQTEYIETSEPKDLSIVLTDNESNPAAWYVNQPRFEPVRTEHYIGSVKEGGSVNFRDIYFNPHGHGTHTECLGHITDEVFAINDTLNEFFFRARLISISPRERQNEDGKIDRVIEPDQLDLSHFNGEALVVRTLPNTTDKLSEKYSNKNPAYFDVECVDILIAAGVKHLLVDVPSVDRESDGGALVFHHRFWSVPEAPNFERTITELIYVDNSIKDDDYIISLQVAPFNNDAAPSRPVLYAIKKELND